MVDAKEMSREALEVLMASENLPDLIKGLVGHIKYVEEANINQITTDFKDNPRRSGDHFKSFSTRVIFREI